MREGGRAIETALIGAPACGWVLLGVAEWIGLPAAPTNPLEVAIALLSIVAAAIALGAVTDRLADLIFDVWLGRGLRRRFLGSDAAYYGSYRQLFEGRRGPLVPLARARSLMRLCRGWSLNTLLALAVFNAAVWTRPLAEALPRERYVAIHGALSLAVVLLVFAYRRFLISELRRLAMLSS